MRLVAEKASQVIFFSRSLMYCKSKANYFWHSSEHCSKWLKHFFSISPSSPIHSTFWKAMSTMLAYLLCQSEILIAMVTCINKDTTSRPGDAATLSSRMAFSTITQTCPTLSHWAWLSFWTIQFKWESKLGKSTASMPFRLTHHLELTTLLLRVKWIELGKRVSISKILQPNSYNVPSHVPFMLKM